jgi:hypothetical protein
MPKSKSKKTILMTGAAMTSAMIIPFASSAQAPQGTYGENTPLTHTSTKYPHKRGGFHAPKNLISGTVTAISGTMLTVVSPNRTAYAVDASGARIAEGQFVSGLTLAVIRVGDRVMVSGTILGTSVTAKTIMDGSLMGRNIFTGTVASVSGSLITITGKNSATLTVDASSAALTKGFLNTSSSTIGVSDIAAGDRLTIVGTISGSTITASAIRDLGQAANGKKGHFGKTPFISGAVSAINGTTITVAGANGTTYTVDAGTAKLSGGLFSSGLALADIQVGDKVMISGTINGTSVTAKTINDASLVGRNVFTGTVASISGSTITLNAKNMTTLTVDATSATITKGFLKGTTIAVSSIKIGDRLSVIGTANGSTITASAINDIGQFAQRSY